MSNTLRTFTNVNDVFVDSRHQELWMDKLEREHWSNVNKRYLLRVYYPLHNVMGMGNSPKWGDVIYYMTGNNYPGYYSCVYKSLKEIGVIKYDVDGKCIIPGPNWNRFYSDESWDWFYMNTSSGMKSYEKINSVGERVRKIYPSNYKNR